MGLLKKTILITALGTIVMVTSAYYGNKYAILGKDDTKYSNNIEVKAPYKVCINEDTVLEFQYTYTDGITTTNYTLPPKYMVNYDRDELSQAYGSWQMDSFSPNKVVFVKKFDSESTQHYILKDYNGYIGVFYKKSGMLKELTSTPISSLSSSDAQKYKDGVTVDGDDNLNKILQDLET